MISNNFIFDTCNDKILQIKWCGMAIHGVTAFALELINDNWYCYCIDLVQIWIVKFFFKAMLYLFFISHPIENTRDLQMT